MAFLYGDGTKSNLESNYIEFLRDVLDFMVQVLMAEHRVRQCRDGGGDRRKKAEEELERLKHLSESITKVLDEASTGGPDSTASRCALNIRQAASNAIKKAADHVKASLTDELRQMTSRVQQERSANFHALEKLLLKHDLPDSAHRVNVRLEDGQAYSARLYGNAGVKVEWVIELDIPGDHLFAAPLRLERIVPNLEIKVPEKSGLMRKSMKLRSQKLTGKYITELQQGAQETTIKLRAAPDPTEAGYDLVISQKAPRVRLSRAARGGEISAPFEPLEEDCSKFLELHAALTRAASELSSNRLKLVEGYLDGKTLSEHEDPSVVVRRLVERMAPTVQEISKHSLSPKELVLKRILGNDRREEIFAPKDDLLAKIEPVPLELRGVFAPLGLGDLSGSKRGSAPAGASEPAQHGNGGFPGAQASDEDDEDEKTAVAQKPSKVILSEEDRARTTQLDRNQVEGGGADDPNRTASEKTIDVALAELESES